MRNLNTSDTLKAVTIAGKIGFKAKDELKKFEGEELDGMQVGLSFFSVAMQYAETDFKEFLSSIAEMTPDEFDKQPFDYPLEVLEHIVENEDIEAFLQRVQLLTKRLFKKS